MAFETFKGPDFTFEVIAKSDEPVDALLAARHRAATGAGRVPCAYLTATWCPANKKLEKTLGDPAMQKAFAEVDIATFDIDSWGDALTAAGYSAATVPAFFLVDASGKPTGPKITGAAWKEDTVSNMAPPLAQFFDAARASRPKQKGTTAMSIALVVIALVVIGAVAWLIVSKQEHDRKSDFERKQHDEIQKSVDESVRHATEKK